LVRPASAPRATYRVQLHAGFTFDDAASIVPYLSELGVSHLYASPVLQAAPGSTHGYDVVDHAVVSAELGGADGLERLTDALRAHGMGLVLDIVPNHMSIAGEENRWWWDVLERGPASQHAAAFDVDWSSGSIVLPVLPGDGRAAIRLVREGERVVVAHEDRRFPLDPATLPQGIDADEIAGINGDSDRLDRLLAKQHYRLASWRSAFEDLAYRRFFDVNELIGLRVEDPAVFAETHRLILGWVAGGLVDGLRIDHPDGLRDPDAYLARLRAAAPGAWIVVEKILGPDEELPATWPIDGTTGYRFANLATGLFVDPAGEAGMSAAWAAVADVGPGWDQVVSRAREEVLSTLLGSDLNRLTDLLAQVWAGDGPGHDVSRTELRDVLRAVAARLPVYRTYVTATPRCVPDGDAALITRTVAAVAEARPDLDPDVLDLLGRVLRLEVDGPLAADLALRFQQLTPAAMAKGVEDTAFYRHHRLVALNEVAGDPGRFGTSPEQFHRQMEVAAARWPAAMLALSTHDTKRSADVRARIALLAEDPDGWRDVVEQMRRASAAHRSGPDRPTDADAYLFHQTVVGAWPIDADRLAAYLLKASREAKLRTSWVAPEAEYEAALERLVRGSLADPAFVEVVEGIVAPLIDAGRRAALGQLVLQLTAPGVPDIYRGDELWDLALVDPDNRRPVDYDVRRRLLAEARNADAATAWTRRDDGLSKLWLVRRTLALRRRRPDAFGRRGTYRAIEGEGALADAVVAFERGREAVTVAPRLVRRVERIGWADTRIALPPGRWRNLDDTIHEGLALLQALVRDFPVALLERVG